MKDIWRELSRHPPGKRFTRHYRKKRNDDAQRKRITLIVGIALVVAGVLMLVVPGPGTVLIVVGVALLARRFLLLARLLDRAEVVGRKLWQRAVGFWSRAPGPIRLLLVLAALAVLGAIGWMGYLVLLRP